MNTARPGKSATAETVDGRHKAGHDVLGLGMVRAALLLGCALLLPACAPRPKPAPPPLALDCGLGFAALSARIAAAPDLRQAPQPPGEPYRYYNALDGATSYMITEPGAPGHPAILKQQATPTGPVNSGCPFGDRAGYAQLVAYLQSLAKGIVR